jgi:hypothetical protein
MNDRKRATMRSKKQDETFGRWSSVGEPLSGGLLHEWLRVK